MGIAVRQAQGALAKAVIALPQPDAVSGGKAHQDLTAAMIETRVSREGDRLGLHRGVDCHARKAGGLHRARRQRCVDGGGEQPFHPARTDALAAAGK